MMKTHRHSEKGRVFAGKNRRSSPQRFRRHEHPNRSDMREGPAVASFSVRERAHPLELF